MTIVVPSTPRRNPKRRMSVPGAPRRNGQKRRVVGLERVKKRLFQNASARMKRRRAYIRSGQEGEYAGNFHRVAKSNVFDKFTKNGAVINKEYGGVITALNASTPVYTGHATHGDSKALQDLFFLTAVRMVVEKHGIALSNFYQQIGDFQITMQYYNGDDATSKVNITTPTTGFSLSQIAGILKGLWRTHWSTLNGQLNSYFASISLINNPTEPTATFAYVDLRDVYIEVFSKSNLKIQNRTIALGVDDDANSSENVANQPLYGRGYFGKGTGLLPKQAVQSSIPALNVETGTGVLMYTPDGGNRVNYGEPPLPTFFSPRPKMAVASLEPGKIKASVLTATFRISQKEFWKMLLLDDANIGTAKYSTAKYGKFHIFALEKTICATAADTKPSIGVEVNQRMGMVFKKAAKQHIQEISVEQTFYVQPA